MLSRFTPRRGGRGKGFTITAERWPPRALTHYHWILLFSALRHSSAIIVPGRFALRLKTTSSFVIATGSPPPTARKYIYNCIRSRSTIVGRRNRPIDNVFYLSLITDVLSGPVVLRCSNHLFSTAFCTSRAMFKLALPCVFFAVVVLAAITPQADAKMTCKQCFSIDCYRSAFLLGCFRYR